MRELVTLSHRGGIFARDRVPGIDLGTIFPISEQAAALRINSRCDGRAVYVRHARINGVMILKEDAFLRHFPKRRRVGRGNEIGPHPVPNDHHDVLRAARGARSAWVTECQDECAENKPSIHHLILPRKMPHSPDGTSCNGLVTILCGVCDAQEFPCHRGKLWRT